MEKVLVLTSYDHIYSYAVAGLLKDNASVEVIQKIVTDELPVSKLTQEFKPSTLIVNKVLFSEHAFDFVNSLSSVPKMKLCILDEYENIFQFVSLENIAIRSGKDFVAEVLRPAGNWELSA